MKISLQQAMQEVGTADAGLFGHATARAGATFDTADEMDFDKWDAIRDEVKKHVHWHTDPTYTVHALPGGRERITSGPSLTDPVVYEG